MKPAQKNGSRNGLICGWFRKNVIALIAAASWLPDIDNRSSYKRAISNSIAVESRNHFCARHKVSPGEHLSRGDLMSWHRSAHTGYVNALAFNPDLVPLKLLSAGNDGKL
jgi:hypothetical protein